ncbi:MAG TPA: hypothetical protein ENK85_09365 [Saprospiraceae bacterium]|nr:hypothetical protein [Saprospiraceae bacterium]
MRIFFSFFICLAFHLVAHGQVGDDFEFQVIIGEEGQADDTTVVLKDSPEVTEDYYVRTIGQLDKDYTGYAVELLITENLLSSDYSLFSGFGKIYFDFIMGKYHYVYPIKFRKKKAIKKYLKNNVRTRQANAVIVQYLHGVRTSVLPW